MKVVSAMEALESPPDVLDTRIGVRHRHASGSRVELSRNLICSATLVEHMLVSREERLEQAVDLLEIG